MAEKKKYDFSGLDEVNSKYDFSGLEDKTVPNLTPALNGSSPSTIEDIITAAPNLFGGAEELAGVSTAIGQKAAEFLNPDLIPKKTFYEMYRQGYEKEKAAQKAAQERSPWAYGGTRVLGGLLTAIPAAPLAAVAPVSTAIGAGALAGGLESEATIEEPLELAKDVVLGGTTGYALQKILPGGPKKPKVEKDILERGEFLPQLETAVKMGEEGVSLGSSLIESGKLSARRNKASSDLAKKFIRPRTELGKVLKATTKQEGLVLTQTLDDIAAASNLEKVLESSKAAIGRKAPELIQKIQNMQLGLLSPNETYALSKKLQKILPKIADPEQAQIFKTGLDSIKDVLGKSVPGFKKAAQDFAQFAEMGPEALLARGIDPELKNIFLGDLKDQGSAKIAEKVDALIQGLRTGGAGAKQKQHELFTVLRELEKYPKLAARFGLEPKELARQFTRAADEAAVVKKGAESGVFQQLWERGLFGLRKASETGLLKGANVYGQAKRKVRDFVQSSQEQFVSAADALRQYGGPDLQGIAENLASEVPQKRNAAIFSILQLPKAKDILGIESDDK